jgi:hypothetical protein
MSIEAMKLALEALEDVQEAYGNHSEWFKQRVDALRAAIEQAEKQEPVAWIKKDKSAIEVSIMSAGYMTNEGFEPLYTAPPQREWQGLTDYIGDQFAHRLAVMLECALLSPEKTWEEAHALLDEYREALYKRDRELGLPYVSGFGKD